MTAPGTGATDARITESSGDGSASGGVVPIRPERIRKRRDFLAAARARRHTCPGFLLQGRKRGPGEKADPDALRVGFTCSKKVGNAVARNRAKRRLRAIAAQVLPLRGRPGWDYVLIGRAGVTATRSFSDLLGDLETALSRVHAPKARR
ncbi:ribonuclease P protein component [Pikeienuella piscinae]|uniref:Ribonuclease P protein component n=1 Tax=Pikeienuella piscinae TaxID=2748098 RepID=A0A7L5BW47_9RHOB|nr:ribonuclease P protein component [Pikeienuella piscinae]QIE54104.1 ribonuclease P protein component [Pikeienuella piscinae]